MTDYLSCCDQVLEVRRDKQEHLVTGDQLVFQVRPVVREIREPQAFRDQKGKPVLQDRLDRGEMTETPEELDPKAARVLLEPLAV